MAACLPPLAEVCRFAGEILKKLNFFSLCYPEVPSKNVSKFNSAVWKAIANLFDNAQLPKI